MSAHGPYQAEQQAREAAPWPGDAMYTFTAADNPRLLLEAIEHAGVTLGSYDWDIVGWLERWERATCVVIAGLITRASTTIPPAYAATVHDAFHDALQWRQAQLAEPCADCDQAKDDPEQRELYGGRCERHTEIADAIGLLRHTARDLGVGVTE